MVPLVQLETKGHMVQKELKVLEVLRENLDLRVFQDHRGHLENCHYFHPSFYLVQMPLLQMLDQRLEGENVLPTLMLKVKELLWMMTLN